MYANVLAIHGVLRWAVLLGAASATLASCNERALQRRWPSLTRRLASLFVGVIDIQLMLGFLLYFTLSPITRSAMHDRALLLRGETGFFGVIHISAMLLAVALAHFANIRLKRPESATIDASVFFALSLAVLLTATPWWRPLVR